MSDPRSPLSSLGISTGSTEEESSHHITSLVSNALSSNENENSELPRCSLEVLADVLDCDSGSGSGMYLDSLNLVPLLIESTCPGTDRFLDVVGRYASAREMVIVLQEVLERCECEYNEEEGRGMRMRTMMRIIRLYALSIPRLTLRKNKSASETIGPLLSQLSSSMSRWVLDDADADADLLRAMEELVSAVLRWVGEEDRMRCKEAIVCLVNTTIQLSSRRSQRLFALSQRSFSSTFPRLSPALSPSSHSLTTTLSLLGLSPSSVLSTRPTLPHLIYLAHTSPSISEARTALTHFFPLILTSLRLGIALDESLSILLTALVPAPARQQQTPPLDTEMIFPLITLLTSIASTHPNPLIRHIAFRVISSILQGSPHLIRLDILRELTSSQGEGVPVQMRVAAVGLVKDAVLEGLQDGGNGNGNVFATSVFGMVLAPILRACGGVIEKRAEDEMEMKRVAEALSAYYVIFQRDVGNQTGIRDKDAIANVEKTLLGLLRNLMAKEEGDVHAEMQLVSIRVSLERIDEAVGTYRSVE